MEIRTNRQREVEPAAPPPPDRSRYLRRKEPQRVRRAHRASRLFMGALRFAGRLGVVALAAGFLAFLFWYAYSSDAFVLRTVRFEGASRCDTRKLEQSIRKSFPARILKINLRKLRSHVEKNNWVRRAEIRRVLPSELVIYVQERTPAALVELNRSLMLADAEGILLDQYGPSYGKMDMPSFKGLAGETPDEYSLYQEENAARIGLGLRMLAEMAAESPELPRRISEVDLSDKENVRILLVDDTVEISIGNRDFLKRFSTFVANLGEYRDLKNRYAEIASVDLRFDGQIIYLPGRGQGELPPSGINMQRE